MSESSLSRNTDLKVRKIMARSHMNADRLEEAVETYAGILRDYPNDVEVLLVLGNLYLASGDSKTAEDLYHRALTLEPENKEIEQQVILAKSEESEISPEPMPTDPEALARLLMRLTGRKVPVTETEMLRAAEMLQEILESTSPAQMVSERLDEIDNLLPALIEINIRQARADGRNDLAKALQGLQINIAYQMEDQKEQQSQPIKVNQVPQEPQPKVVKPKPPEIQPFKGRVLVLVPDLYDLTPRLNILVDGLKQVGCKVKRADQFNPDTDAVADVVIVSNPHLNPKLMQSMATASTSGVPIILDLDDNYEDMPVSHPYYAKKGLGDAIRGRAYATALLLAKAVTVASNEVNKTLVNSGHRSYWIPDGWSRSNRLWNKPHNPRNTINIGWVGSAAQLEDVFEVRRIVLRVMREFPQSQMVVIGNSQAYRLFESLPSNRRLYLPMVGYEEYPYLLGQMDILLAPHRKIPYNLKQSDRLVMEASVKRLPWIGSDIPAYMDWGRGGFIAHTPSEWHGYLRQLIMDEEMRKGIGDEGFIKAQAREQQQIGLKWQQTIAEVLAHNTPRLENLRKQPQFDPFAKSEKVSA